MPTASRRARWSETNCRSYAESGDNLRCRRLGNELTVAIDPEGLRHTIRARCSSIRLNSEMPVEELETNYGGQIILDGIDLNPVWDGWTVCGEVGR